MDENNENEQVWKESENPKKIKTRKRVKCIFVWFFVCGVHHHKLYRHTISPKFSSNHTCPFSFPPHSSIFLFETPPPPPPPPPKIFLLPPPSQNLLFLFLFPSFFLIFFLFILFFFYLRLGPPAPPPPRKNFLDLRLHIHPQGLAPAKKIWS